MEVLRELYRAHGDAIEIVLFGCHQNYLRSLPVPDDFSWTNAGVLTRPQTASLLNEIDIFVDFSTWQTMGLTAMEAMCCGAAVIVPLSGGASSFVKHEENGIVVDTSSREACLAALERLVTDEQLRIRLQCNAVFDICQFFREKAAFNILNAIFEKRHDIAVPRNDSKKTSGGQVARARPEASFRPRRLASVGGSEMLRPADESAGAGGYDRVLEGKRARSQVVALREQLIEQGRALWKGKHLLFVLPISERSGGGNVVLDEAEAMRKMGVEVSVVNLARYRKRFEQHYHDNALPVIYVKEGAEISELLPNYDAVIATWCGSVDWLTPRASSKRLPIRGYYVQDFEPLFFNEGSTEFKIALDSYTRYPDLVRVTKTDWNRARVKEEIGVDCTVVGPSVNLDLYFPRRREGPEWPNRPLRIAAMIRPSTSHRAPRLTLELLREFYRTHEQKAELHFFGCDTYDLRTLGVPDDFPYRNAGILTRPQMADLFNEIDIFADFSTYQAMGLTAMEAMCCGAAVIVPQRGGAISFVKDESNGLMTDTSSKAACLAALERLTTDVELRTRLQTQATFDICQFFPERAAYNILSAMFGSDRRDIFD
jgi:glycosyltransferase involved in cell wall biosynthesis